MYSSSNNGIDKTLTEYKYASLLKRKKVVITKKTLHFPPHFYSKLKSKLTKSSKMLKVNKFPLINEDNNDDKSNSK